MPLRKPTGNLPVVFLALKSDRFEVQPRPFVQSEHQVHILHGLSRSPFQQVIDRAHHQQLVTVFFPGRSGICWY